MTTSPAPNDLPLVALDAFARMACEHPDACACDRDYPAWAAELATRPTYVRPLEAS